MNRLSYLHRTPSYLNYRFKNRFLWDRYYNRLVQAKLKNPVVCTPQITNQILDELQKNDFVVKGYRINIEDYKLYLKNAKYQTFSYYYKGGRANNFSEKSLEHYLAAKFLDLCEDDVYVDIANGDSPVPEIYSQLYGCEAYRQDIAYPKGIHGRVIGGDASNLPLTDEFFSKMGLHCSFEHFENSADINFVREARRLLRPQGRLCILPLYLYKDYVIQTNPVCVPHGFNFEKDATLYCVRNWQVHHSRFYSVPQLVRRIKSNLEQLDLTIHLIENGKEVDPSCYVKFVAVLQKK